MGKQSVRGAVIGAITMLALIAGPANAEAKAIYVADEGGGGAPTGCGPSGQDRCGAIFEIPPAGGNGSVLADGPLEKPSGLIRFGDRFLLAADYGTNDIERINRNTGAIRTFVSSDKFAQPIDLAKKGDRLYVTDYERNALFRVNLDTKAVRKVNETPLAPNAAGLAIAGKRAYVSNWDDTIYRVGLRSGNVGKVVTGDPQIAGADGLALSKDRDFLYVAAPMADNLARVNLSSGATKFIASVPDIVAVTLRPAGGFLVSANESEVLRVSLDGSSVVPFSQNPLYFYPHDIVVGWVR